MKRGRPKGAAAKLAALAERTLDEKLAGVGIAKFDDDEAMQIIKKLAIVAHPPECTAERNEQPEVVKWREQSVTRYKEEILNFLLENYRSNAPFLGDASFFRRLANAHEAEMRFANLNWHLIGSDIRYRIKHGLPALSYREIKRQCDNKHLEISLDTIRRICRFFKKPPAKGGATLAVARSRSRRA